jgi:hypothetical protein
MCIPSLHLFIPIIASQVGARLSSLPNESGNRTPSQAIYRQSVGARFIAPVLPLLPFLPQSGVLNYFVKDHYRARRALTPF